MKTFRHLRSVRMSYREQGLVYFLCANYRTQPPGMRRKIDQLCERVGGEYAPALKALLTTEADWVTVCDRYHVSAATLDRLRRAFYLAW